MICFEPGDVIMKASMIAILSILITFSAAGDIPAKLQMRLSQIDQLYYEGKYDEAIQAYQNLIKGNPDLGNRPAVLVKLGRCYLRKGD